MSIVTDIQNTLNLRLSTLPNIPPVSWPNVEFEPVDGTLYLRASILPASTTLETVEGTEGFRGVYQVDVFAPLGTGIQTINAMADSVCDHFAADRDLSGVRIRAISATAPIRNGAWFVLPISISYSTYHTR